MWYSGWHQKLSDMLQQLPASTWQMWKIIHTFQNWCPLFLCATIHDKLTNQKVYKTQKYTTDRSQSQHDSFNCISLDSGICPWHCEITSPYQNASRMWEKVLWPHKFLCSFNRGQGPYNYSKFLEHIIIPLRREQNFISSLCKTKLTFSQLCKSRD